MTAGFSDREKTSLKKRYFSGKGKINKFSLFVELGFRIGSPDAFLCFIVPPTILRNERYWAIRYLILTESHLSCVFLYAERQFKACVESCVLLMRKTPKPGQQKWVTRIRIDGDPASDQAVGQDNLLRNDKHRIVAGVAPAIYVKGSVVDFGTICDIRDGISTGYQPFPAVLIGRRSGDLFVAENSDSEQFDPLVHKPVIDGSEFHALTQIKWEGRYIKYDKRIEQNPRPLPGRSFNCQLREQWIFDTVPRIVSRQTANRLIGA